MKMRLPFTPLAMEQLTYHWPDRDLEHDMFTIATSTWFLGRAIATASTVKTSQYHILTLHETHGTL